VVKHKEKIFGNSSFYFDIERALSGGMRNTRIPDGMLLTLENQTGKF